MSTLSQTIRNNSYMNISKDDIRDKYKKLLADYQELSKSLSKSKRDIAKDIRHDIIRKFAELYKEAKIGSEKYNEKGAELLYKKCRKIFNDLNVTILDVDWFSANCPEFNETYAEAIDITDTLFSEYDNTIDEVVEDGFMDNDGVIVYAKVIVSQYLN